MSFSTISADTTAARAELPEEVPPQQARGQGCIEVSEHPYDLAHDLKCELAAEVLRSFGSLRLRVYGSSMLPVIWPGDILHLERAVPGAVCSGDIVLFRRDRRLFAHRVLNSGERAILTRGDALPYADPVIPKDEVLGRVAAIVRNGKCFEPRKRPSVLERAIAGLVRSSNFAGRVIVGMHGFFQNRASQS